MINNTLNLMNWACSRLSGPDTPAQSAQAAALKQSVQIQDAGQIGEPKLQTDRQPGQPGLPLCNRKAVPVTLYLNRPNFFQKELTTVKDVSTNDLRAYIEKMLAEEALTEAAEAWTAAQEKQPGDTVKDPSQDEALKILNEALNTVHSAWPEEGQQPHPGQFKQRRQSLADNPCFGLFQELNIVYCQTPTLNIPNQLAKLTTRAGYPLTGQRSESSPATPRRPLLATMYELCQQYPDITLGQLMATLDSQPQAAHSEAVQTLLRFRDNPWFPAEAENRQAQPDKETREATEVYANPLQTETLPDHSRNNQGQSGEQAKPPLTPEATGKNTTCSTSTRPDKVIQVTSFRWPENSSKTAKRMIAAATFVNLLDTTRARRHIHGFRDGGGSFSLTVVCSKSRNFGIDPPNQASDFCSNFCVTKSRSSSRVPDTPIPQPVCKEAYQNILSLFYEDECDNTENRILFGDSHDCLNTIAQTRCPQLQSQFSDHRFCNLCNAAANTTLRCIAPPRTANFMYVVQNYTQPDFFRLDEVCENNDSEYLQLCNAFCISLQASEQTQYHQQPWAIAQEEGGFCRDSYSHINRLFDMKTASNYGCMFFDTGGTIYLRPDSGSCLYNYAYEQCGNLHKNGTLTSNNRFCHLCNSAKNPLLFCDAPPTPTITGLWLSPNESIPLDKLCESTTHNATLCDHVCITQTLANNDRYRQTDWANLVGPTRCAAASKAMTQLFLVDTFSHYGCEVIRYGTSGFQLIKNENCILDINNFFINQCIQSITADPYFSPLCNAAKDRELHITPINDRPIEQFSITPENQSASYPLSEACDQDPTNPGHTGLKGSLCQNFCIDDELPANTDASHWKNLVGATRCAQARKNIDQMFLWKKATSQFNCTVRNNDDYFFTLLGGDSSCLNNYATAECIKLKSNNTQAAEPDFTPLCDAAKDPELHYHYLPNTISHITRDIPLATLCNQTLSERSLIVNTTLCRDYCLNPQNHGDIPESRCLDAQAAIGSVFDLATANNRYDCQAQWDSLGWVNPDQADCLVKYLNQECLAMAEGGDNTSPLCDVCDSAGNRTLQCNPMPSGLSLAGIMITAGGIAVGTSGIVYLGYQWYQGYKEKGFGWSMLARPFLPSPKIRPDAPQPDSEPMSYLVISMRRPDEPQAINTAGKWTDYLPLRKTRPYDS